MDAKISHLTVNELKNLISKTLNEAIEDYLEYLKALSSKDYANLIRESKRRLQIWKP